jgi:hypothetical protein
MKVKFGLWLINFGLKIARKGMDISGVTDTLANNPDVVEEEEDHSITVYSVLEGPFTQSDLGVNWDGPYEAEAYLLVKLEYGGKVSDVEWYFETAEEAFVWVRHFKQSIEPIVIEGKPDD